MDRKANTQTKKSVKMSTRASVAAIVTTKNEAEVIETLLQSLRSQTYKNIQIIVVDNHSTDQTKKIALKYTKKFYTFGPERSAQRNYGANKSNCTYNVFFDADMKVSATVIEKCVQKMQKNTRIGGIIIPEISVATTYWEKVKAFERSFYNSEGDMTTDAARFYRSDAFQNEHGFDESLTGPEDWDLSERIQKKGWKIERVSPVIYHYERVTSLFSLVKKKYYYGLKAHAYMQKNDVAVFSSKTIYFLRPVFYRQWRKLILHVDLTLGMITMFLFELIGGGLGYIVGKSKQI